MPAWSRPPKRRRRPRAQNRARHPQRRPGPAELSARRARLQRRPARNQNGQSLQDANLLNAGAVDALRAHAPWPNPQQWAHAALLGALMLGGGMGGVAVAEQTVGSGLVVAFIAVVPLMIVLINLFWRVKPGRLEMLGIGVGLVGVLMLTRG